MNGRLSRLLYKAHLFLGLFVSLQCLVLFATGALLLFREEIETVLDRDGHASVSAPSRVDPKVFESAVDNAKARFPRDLVLAVAHDEHDPTTVTVRMGIDGSEKFRGARRLHFDAATGAPKEITSTSSKMGFDWLLELHRDFLMGSPGKLYVGVLGVLYLLTLISGFVIYGVFSKKRRYAELRASSPRALSADWHKLTGSSVFAWSLAIGFTGAMLAFNGSLIKLYQYTELQSLRQTFGLAPAATNAQNIARVISSAEAARPGLKASYVAFPGNEFSTPGHFFVLLNGSDQRLGDALSELVIVDAESGTLTESRELPWYLKVLMLSEPLHFGDYGGIALKLAWLILAAASSILPASGLLILFFRKRRRHYQTDRRGASVTALRPSLWRRPYTLPLIFVFTTWVSMLGALWTSGSVDIAWSIGLAAPVAIGAVLSFAQFFSRTKTPAEPS